jgi:hypothetical protein
VVLSSCPFCNSTAERKQRHGSARVEVQYLTLSAAYLFSCLLFLPYNYATFLGTIKICISLLRRRVNWGKFFFCSKSPLLYADPSVCLCHTCVAWAVSSVATVHLTFKIKTWLSPKLPPKVPSSCPPLIYNLKGACWIQYKALWSKKQENMIFCVCVCVFVCVCDMLSGPILCPRCVKVGSVPIVVISRGMCACGWWNNRYG